MLLPLFIIVCAIVLIIVMVWLTRSALFDPVRAMSWEPEEEYHDLYIKDVYGGNSINSWYFLRSEDAPCILFFHGNNGNMSWREYMVNATKEIGVNMFMIDYRGFGRSRGSPTQRGVCEDGICAYDYLRTMYKPKDIIIWGESLGGSIATYVASERDARCLVLLSTFSSLDDIVLATNRNPWVMKSLAFLIKYLTNEMPTKGWIEKVNCPIAIIHSDSDTLIPYSVSETLFSHIKHNDKVHITIKGDHSTPDMEECNLRDILDVCGLNGKGLSQERICRVIESIESADKFPVM